MFSKRRLGGGDSLEKWACFKGIPAFLLGAAAEPHLLRQVPPNQLPRLLQQVAPGPQQRQGLVLSPALQQISLLLRVRHIHRNAWTVLGILHMEKTVVGGWGGGGWGATCAIIWPLRCRNLSNILEKPKLVF